MRRVAAVSVVAVVIVTLAGVTLAWRSSRGHEAENRYRLAPVKRASLVATISATGTVEPEEVVDIGAQVGGRISEFGTDKKGAPIDYGSAVEAGTVLARIDDSLYAADVASATATLAVSRANLVSAQANVLQMEAKETQAEQDWKRAEKLGPSEALAPSAYDQYKSNYEVAKANVAVAKAGVEQARATIAEAQAVLDRAQRNLGYCTISSPVKGVIIDRRVNIGQTVVSSLNAPSLFLLAKDLTRIQVWVSVNEADIGSIHPGMPATFTVDAFSGEVFHGRVGKVRLNATMTQNVVTYTVEVVTDNSSGRLLPYLTANVQFITGSREQVLAVPSEALRWQPRPDQVALPYRHGAPPSGSGTESEAAGQKGPQHQGTLWVQEGNYVKPLSVQTGLTDGRQTEVEAPGLSEGLAVVSGEPTSQTVADGSAPGASPFTPQFGRSRGNAAPAGGGSAPGGRPAQK